MRPVLKGPIHIHFRALDIYFDRSLILSTREAKAENNYNSCKYCRAYLV